MAGDAAAGAKWLANLMSEAVALVAEERVLNLAEGQTPSRLSPLIAIDQGEELFAAEDAAQSNRLLDMMGHLLGSPPAGLDPYVLVTIRADSFDVDTVRSVGFADDLIGAHALNMARSRVSANGVSSRSGYQLQSN